LTTLLTTLATASAQCPDGGQCYTEKEAKKRIQQECAEAHRKLKACNSELAKCDNMEALKNKCKGNLEESRRDSRRKAKTIKVQDREIADKHDTSTVVKLVVGTAILFFGAGGAAAKLSE